MYTYIYNIYRDLIYVYITNIIINNFTFKNLQIVKNHPLNPSGFPPHLLCTCFACKMSREKSETKTKTSQWTLSNIFPPYLYHHIHISPNISLYSIFSCHFYSIVFFFKAVLNPNHLWCYDITFGEQPKRGWKFGVFDPGFGFSFDAPEWTILPSPTISPFLVFENAQYVVSWCTIQEGVLHV